MAIQYIDTSAASDGSGTIGSPFNTVNGKTLTGNATYFKYGTTVGFAPDKFIGANAVLAAYGDALRGKPVLYPTSAGTAICYVQASNVSYVNLAFDGRNLVNYPTYWDASTGSIANLSATDCSFTGGNLYGMYVKTDSGAANTASALQFLRSDFFGNVQHGLLFQGSIVGANVIECNGFNNSTNAARHNFSSLANRTVASSGWATGAAPIYSRSAGGNTILAVMTSDSTYPLLVDGGTTTTPAAGQFSQSGGTLYIHLGGTNPNSGVDVTFGWAIPQGINYLFCRSWGAKSTDAIEGTGIQFDDFTSNSLALGCDVFGNVGGGIISNGGVNNRVIACNIYANGRRGIAFYKGSGGKIIGNVVRSNNVIQTSNTEEITVDAMATATIVSNNIVTTPKTYGIYFSANSASGSAAATNDVVGATSAAVTGVTATGGQTVDPNLSLGLRPGTDSLLNAGTDLGGRDYYGKDFTATPTIGAVEDWPARSTSIRAIATRSVGSRFIARRRSIAGA